MTMIAWPRRLIHFPIILIAISQQLIMGLLLLIDPEVHMVTAIHSVYQIVRPQSLIGFFMIAAAVLAIVGFQLRRKIDTILCMIPQQLLLYISAGGSFRAIWLGQFADGVERSHAFLLADQAPSILIALFHSWAIVLILIFSEKDKADRPER
jgi:hypothetical protein